MPLISHTHEYLDAGTHSYVCMWNHYSAVILFFNFFANFASCERFFGPLPSLDSRSFVVLLYGSSLWLLHFCLLLHTRTFARVLVETESLLSADSQFIFLCQPPTAAAVAYELAYCYCLHCCLPRCYLCLLLLRRISHAPSLFTTRPNSPVLLPVLIALPAAVVVVVVFVFLIVGICALTVTGVPRCVATQKGCSTVAIQNSWLQKYLFICLVE